MSNTSSRVSMPNVQSMIDRIRQSISSATSSKGGAPNGAELAQKIVSQVMRELQKDGFDSAPGRGQVQRNASQNRAPATQKKDAPEQRQTAGKSNGKASGKSHADGDAVAKKIAKHATHWHYDNTGGKTWQQTLANEDRFDRTKSGVCTDMALQAAQEFERKGVDARVKFGHTSRGNHAWVQYRDDGKWKMFDPTAAACTKNAKTAITPRDNGLYNYGSTFSTYDIGR